MEIQEYHINSMNVQSASREGDLLAEERRYFNNKNGDLSIEDFLHLIHTNQLDEYMRHFKSTQHKCPPRELRASDQMCFFCISDFQHCLSQVKEYKAHYKVRSKKYSKEDIANWVLTSNSQETKSTEE